MHANKIHVSHAHHPRSAKAAIKDIEKAAAGPSRTSVDSFATLPLDDDVEEEEEEESGVAMGVVGS